MKKTIALFLCVVLLIAASTPVSAAECNSITELNESYTIVLDDGTVITNEVIISSQSRSSTKTATRRATVTRDDVLVAVIAFQATFRYDGTTVSVVSKSVTQTDTYDGWEYVQNSFTSSGGTVTLNAKLTKWFIFNTPFSMTLSCDKDGNISYT